MAAIYDIDSGNELTTGLQGCNVCDEAIQVAQGLADSMGRDVHLVDDDGEWAVHPEIDGKRELADPLPVTNEDDDTVESSDEIHATIAERGNGFPSVGDRVYYSPTNSIYQVVSMGRIQTRQYAANWVDAVLEDTGLCASDLSDQEFDDLLDCTIELDDDAE